MKNFIFRSFIFMSLCIPLFTYAFPGDEVEISGMVKSFNEKEVEIQTDKFVYKLPRNLILLSELKSEQKISVSVLKTQLSSFKRTPLSKK